MTPRPMKVRNKTRPMKVQKRTIPAKNMSFGINLYFTTSKTLGYAIFIVGSIFAFINKDSDVFIFSSSIAGGLLGLKTWQSSALARKRLEYDDNNSWMNNGNNWNNNGEIGSGLEGNGENINEISSSPPVEDCHGSKSSSELG